MTCLKYPLLLSIALYGFFYSFFFSAPLQASEHITNIKFGYHDGFYMATLDDRYKVKLGGRINFLYHSSLLDNAADSHGFNLSHGKVYLGGNAYSKNIEYFLQTAFGQYEDSSIRFVYPSESDAGQFRLEDYYVRLHWGSYYIQMGQFKVPFSRQSMTYSGNLSAPFANHVSNAFSLRRDQGLMISQYSPYFHISGAVFNGQSPVSIDNGSPINPNQSNTDNGGMMYVGRLGFAPFGYAGYSEGDVEDSQNTKLELNGSIAYSNQSSVYVDNDDTIDIPEADILSVNSDLLWKKKGLAFQAEYFFRKINAAQQSDITGWGYYLQPSIFLIPSELELSATYAYSNLNDLIEDTAHEFSGGLNIYFSKDHRYKMQTRYTYRQFELSNSSYSDHLIHLGLQVSL